MQQQHAETLAREQQLRCDYEALLASMQTLVADRDRLQKRVAELEAANKKLTHMLWGRRSERREDPAQLQLWDQPAADLFDLDDAEKPGLKYIGDAVTERLW